MKAEVWILTYDGDRDGREITAHGTEQAANNAAAGVVSLIAQQKGCKDDVTSANWRDVLEGMQIKGCDDYLWLECCEVELPPLGPLAVVVEGGAVQDICSNDERWHGADILVIDYDTDGAEEVYRVKQIDPSSGTVDRLQDAYVSGYPVGEADGIDLPDVWRQVTEEGPQKKEMADVA